MTSRDDACPIGTFAVWNLFKEPLDCRQYAEVPVQSRPDDSKLHRIFLPTAAALLIAIIGMAFRVIHLSDRSLWFDEASSWLTAKMPAEQMLQSLRRSTHVPLYYPLLRGWMSVFGESPAALRGFSVLFGMLTVALAGVVGTCLASTTEIGWMRLSNSTGGDNDTGHADTPDGTTGAGRQSLWFGLLCAAVCAVSAFQIFASAEARMYSLGTSLALFSTLCCVKLLNHATARRWWLLLSLATVAALYTHHFLAFQAAVQAFWLWLSVVRVQDRQSGAFQAVRRFWNTSVGLVLVAWLPALVLWWEQFRRIRQDFWIPCPGPWTIPQTLLEFLIAHPPGLRWRMNDEAIAATLLIFSVVLPAADESLRRGRPVLKLLMLQWLCPMLAVGLISLVTPLWEARYFRFAHVSLLLCIASGVSILATGRPARLLVSGMLLALLSCGSVAMWTLRDIPHRQAMRGACGYIHEHRGEKHETVVVRSGMDFIIARYYGTQNGWPADRVRLWTGRLRDPGPAVHLVTDADWWDPAQDAAQQVWLLESAECQPCWICRDPEQKFLSDTWIDGWTLSVRRLNQAELLRRAGATGR